MKMHPLFEKNVIFELVMLVFWVSLCIAEGWTLGSLEEQVVYIFAYLPKDLVVGKSIGARRRARKTNGVELERR